MALKTKKQKLVTKPLGKFLKENDLTTISGNIRFNVNNYPYITFVDSENEAENIYFSKKVNIEGHELTKEFLESLSIAYAKNAKGEIRIKLCLSTRMDITDLWED